MESAPVVRPTKKQRQLLEFIAEFISAHGYSPSYREIMSGLNYTSVATVSVHVGNLIKRGHLYKRNKSARSLEVADGIIEVKKISEVTEVQEKWLIDLVAKKIKEAEQTKKLSQKTIDDTYVLIGALHVLGFGDAVRALVPRISELKATE